jgi:hypothetical protein
MLSVIYGPLPFAGREPVSGFQGNMPGLHEFGLSRSPGVPAQEWDVSFPIIRSRTSYRPAQSDTVLVLSPQNMTGPKGNKMLVATIGVPTN